MFYIQYRAQAHLEHRIGEIQIRVRIVGMAAKWDPHVDVAWVPQAIIGPCLSRPSETLVEDVAL